MAPSMSSTAAAAVAAVLGDSELTSSKRNSHSRAVSSPASPKSRRQSLAALSDAPMRPALKHLPTPYQALILPCHTSPYLTQYHVHASLSRIAVAPSHTLRPGSMQNTRSSRHSNTQPSQPNSVHNAKDNKDTKDPSRASSPSPPANAGLDPLSTQIYLRTNSNPAEPTIAQRLRNQTGRPDSPAADNLQKQSSDLGKSPNALLDSTKERRCEAIQLFWPFMTIIVGIYFGRLCDFGLACMCVSRKKDEDEQDSDSELGDLRTDGTHAQVLTSVIGAGGGYIPLYKEPPRYIRVKAHNKKDREFNHLFLAQELMGTKRPTATQGRAPATAVGSKILKGGDAIWAAEFSMDGRYLAVAGKDQIVRVFAVISTPEERKAHEDEEAQNGTTGERLSAPVFRSKPVREFHGHTGEVLALSWSKNNFLLSSSMDKTVRLWHMTRNDCLCTFKHKDVVTSIAFHPTDDRFFLAGSLDAQLRLWSIPDRTVAFEVTTGEFITAVAFTPDGKMAICGVLSGMATFYITEGLKLRYQIHVRSSRGKNAKGSKITGIRTLAVTSGPDKGIIKVLITSNDSRVRVYNLNDKVIQVKYKGLENQSSQINARFSDDAQYIVCGSEDRKAYIWKLNSQDSELKDKQPYESFDAHPEVVTTALMAPTKTRLLLSASGDPIYDLCNPPPVMLRSLEESATSQTALSEGDESSDEPSVVVKRPEETPAFLERSKHFDGHIVITTDRTGTIKVFRQDCAYTKRQQGLWESGSKFSGRIAGVGRTGSIMTRTSGGSRIHSRRGSLNIGGPNPIQLQHASDRINSWRQDIDEGTASWSGTPNRSDRSISPTKQNRSPVNTSAVNLASEARKQPYASSPVGRNHGLTSPTGSMRSRTTFRSTREQDKNFNGPMSPPTPSFNLITASDSEGKDEKGEGRFWNLSRWRGGLPSLRYSTVLENPGGSNGSTGHTRSGSEYLMPRDKAAGRMSLGITDINRLKNEDVTNRRRSAGPLLSSKLSQENGKKGSFDTRDYLSNLNSPKKRVDSGVGRMSPDLTDSN
ncbi:WD40-repeat-containing domain protein [Dactylonectria macrodidyma]|uniref:WD40-repeat-containing domain protein n=1 Tax=Dactylonectria macrodidyma TaxID=307937 RepID=A0A9P9EN99_9HYPO|nr:WD40-repeat-containing domain protein [Dactylonectria macrodidyma]